MSDIKSYIHKEEHCLAIPLMLVLIFISYSNTITYSWHLDDVANILWNKPLHLNSLSLSELIKTFFAYPEQQGRLYRPISCLTLALNWFFGQDSTVGYHLVNITIHLVTAFFLYKSILLLLDSPRLKGKYQAYEQSIAILATLLWAVNPIQTQAITYIIQRMASLAALFYLMGIFFYISGRSTIANQRERIACFSLMILCFLFALGSKENTIVFPFSILFIEIIFFNSSKPTRKDVLYFIAGLAILLGLSTFLFTNGNILQSLTSYDTRNFNLFQHVMTESRVVCWYLSLLFYPSVTRLSLEHDIHLSTSLLNPATTLSSIIFLITISLGGLLGYKKYPILAFSVLFFLLNHIVESTILPLELVFEHRNYLPSLFLFWPVAIFFVQLLNMYEKQRVMYCIIIVFLSLLISSLAIGTYLRNQVWRTEKSLWTDAVTKAPNSMRAFLNLAYTYEYEGDLQTAFRLDQQALGKISPTRNKFTLIAYNNMGNIMRKMAKYPQALYWYDEGLKIDDKNKDILFNKSLAQMAGGHHTDARQTLVALLNQDPLNGLAYLVLGNIEIQEGDPHKGMEALKKALQLSPPSFSAPTPSSWQILLSLSLASNRMHQYDKALFYIHLARNWGAPDFLVGLYSLENHILSKSSNSIDHQLEMIFSKTPLTQLRRKIFSKQEDIAYIALDKNLILGYIEDWINNLMATPTMKGPVAH